MPLVEARGRYVRRIAASCLCLLVMGLLAEAQVRLSGKIVNRDGTPQRGCRVEFFRNRQDRPAFEAYTDDYGNFYLTNPPRERFAVKVSSGSRWQWTTDVTIGDALNPSTPVVDW